MGDVSLKKLAETAGLVLEWDDSDGRPQRLPAETQRVLLARLGFPAESEQDVKSSLQRLERWNNPQTPAELPPLVTADQGAEVDLPCPLSPGSSFSLLLESGSEQDGKVNASGCLPAIDEAGYHQLNLDGRTITLAVAPKRCYSPADAAGRSDPHLWGLAAQLYSLRRPRDGGFGDALALEHLGLAAARQGVAAIAVSPTHAMFSTDPAHFSPYSPSSRLLNNVLYCAPEGLLGRDRVDRAIARSGLEDQLRALEEKEMIDWPQAGVTKLTWLRALYEDTLSRSDPEGQALQQRLAEFRRAGGEVLEDHCRFEALLSERGPGSWRDWPEELRNPRSAEVARFAKDASDEVGFHAFLQWLVAESLSRTQAALREAGMTVGIIADLAVGADDAGSQTWSRQGEMLEGVSIGAPPDTFNVHGQDWGLSAFSPHGLVRSGFRSFIDMLRASLSHAGGVRIDHILGFMRLWLVPHGAGPTQGGYVSYPLEDMLRLVALESWRHRAIVIGEDLGTVAAGFSEKLADRGILGMQVLWFERDEEGGFIPPEDWSAEAMATTSTHDLPTVAGWWAGRDIDWRADLGLFREDQDVEDERRARAKDRAHLARALGLLRGTTCPEALEAQDLRASQVLDACALHLGQVPAPLAIVPVEDVLGLEEQANLPATMDEHPNWRRRWSPDAKDLLALPGVRHRLEEVRRGRAQSEEIVKKRRESSS